MSLIAKALLMELATEVLVPLFVEVVDDLVHRDDNKLSAEQGEAIKANLASAKERPDG